MTEPLGTTILRQVRRRLRCVSRHSSSSATCVDQRRGAVDVALHEMPVDAVADAERPLDVDLVAGLEQAEVGLVERFVDDVEAEFARRTIRRRSGRRR